MKMVLAGLQWETFLVHVDGVVMFVNTVEHSVERLAKVSQRLRLPLGSNLNPGSVASSRRRLRTLVTLCRPGELPRIRLK